MKSTKIITLSAIILSSVGGFSSVSFAADGGTYDSNAVVKFVPNTDPTNPVDPTNPEENIDPVDPTNPEGKPNPGTNGPLSIDFASSFNFGENKITSQDMIYNAAPQTFKVGEEGPNYVQVSDNRGGAKGWALQVEQGGQFKSTSGVELTGAKIQVNNGEMVSASDSIKPAIFKTSFDLTSDGAGAAQNVITAADGEGAGTWVYRFGDEATKGESVTLTVPGKTTKVAEEYATKLTWTLIDVPGNSEGEEEGA